VRQPSLGQSICCPDLVFKRQPDKEFAPQRSPCLPNPLPWGKGYRSCEECLVCRFTGVVAQIRESPYMLISRVRANLHFFNQIPEVEIFY
jgi:hypothetical protein